VNRAPAGRATDTLNPEGTVRNRSASNGAERRAAGTETFFLTEAPGGAAVAATAKTIAIAQRAMNQLSPMNFSRVAAAFRAT
jgi:hypothetical protein